MSPASYLTAPPRGVQLKLAPCMRTGKGRDMESNEENGDDTASQDLEEKNPSVPPSEEGVPSEEFASKDLPGIPEEADELDTATERGDE